MTWDVLIIVGGPAGAIAAADLARCGYRVGVLERKRFPRGKLCGEFLAPRGVARLQQHGLLTPLLRAGARRIRNAVFISLGGHSHCLPLSRFSESVEFGLGISRATLDHLLLDHARACGADVLERVCVTDAIASSGRIVGVRARLSPSGTRVTFFAAVVIDASGRARVLGSPTPRARSEGDARLFAFQAHVSGIAGVGEAVQLYFYPSGYGGLVRIEGDLVNLCGLTTWATLRRAGGDPKQLLALTMGQNPRAQEILRNARLETPLAGCGPLRFGLRALPREYLAVGDAAASLDPFLGHGITLALESGLLAAALTDAAFRAGDPTTLAPRYARAFRRCFARIWRAAGWLRPIASHHAVGDRVLALLPERALAHRLLRALLFGGRTG
ncbi:Putative thiazole biosynthetic enzyme [bacterium HR08]|nr:Putative thiazole biosynthetic enzyme [bacterium HR08]